VKPIALLIADVHLSHSAPVARSAEPDWYAAQGRVLGQVRDLADKYKCPIVCAGDVMDRWNSSPELINWAIDNLPPMFAIPGQHDLPLHNYEDVGKSAYWTLVKAGVITDFGKRTWMSGRLGEVVWFPFPWGSEIFNINPTGSSLEVAVVHSYVWKQGASYADPPLDSEFGRYSDRLKGYDVAVFGDNHHGFEAKAGNCSVYNCGCLIRRKSDERNLCPAVGLLMEDGTVKRYFLDVSGERWLEEEGKSVPERNPGMDRFLAELESLEADRTDFREAVLQAADVAGVSEGVRAVLLESLEIGK